MNERFVMINRRTDEYYTVFGWSSATTKYLSSAVVFPNQMIRKPTHPTWKRLAVNWDGSFAKLKTA